MGQAPLFQRRRQVKNKELGNGQSTASGRHEHQKQPPGQRATEVDDAVGVACNVRSAVTPTDRCDFCVGARVVVEFAAALDDLVARTVNATFEGIVPRDRKNNWLPRPSYTFDKMALLSTDGPRRGGAANFITITNFTSVGRKTGVNATAEEQHPPRVTTRIRKHVTREFGCVPAYTYRRP